MRSGAASCAGTAISGAFHKSLAGPAANVNKEATQRLPVGGDRETATRRTRTTGSKTRTRASPSSSASTAPALSNAERARLSSFVKSLGAETKAGNLFVTGYTCDLGSKAHNDVLAIERAEAVEAYLRKTGLHAMWVTGMGKCCYATKDPSKRYLNRRVEVIISKKEAAK